MPEIKKLLDIMKALRDPRTGCPWDIEQDFKSIAAYTVEEAYEVADAIERDNMDDLKDELGDLLFQVVYHAQMAEEQAAFKFDDVVRGISEKLVRRHPHVFGDEQVKDNEHLAKRWEEHKHAERKQKQGAESALDGIASTLPALRWSEKLQKRAAGTGFDWPSIHPVFDKLSEELNELHVELKQDDNHERILDEYGDVLFVCVNLGKHMKVNPEEALRHANNKFISRFTVMEKLMEQDGASFDDLTLEQMEAYWQKAKSELSANER